MELMAASASDKSKREGYSSTYFGARTELTNRLGITYVSSDRGVSIPGHFYVSHKEYN